MQRIMIWAVAPGLLVCSQGAVAQSNVDPVHKYAWTENVGWTNWRDANGSAEGVFVDIPNGYLSGYIWGENVGWINVGNGNGPYANQTGADFGVNLDPGGDLDGYGWAENVGWVNFDTRSHAPDQARYDAAAARFRGYAWGENIGWINLDDATHYVAVSSAGPAAPRPASYPDNRPRNRYLAFDPNPENTGIDVAFKVTLTSVRLGSCDGSGSPDVEGWPCRTADDCRACSTDGNPCWTAALNCQAGGTCDPTGAVCLNDHTVDPATGHQSVGRSWWVGAAHPTTGVHLLVTQPYRKVSSAWGNPVVAADCEVVPTGVYEVVAVGIPGGDESDPLEVKTAAAPVAKFWADCVAPLGDYCTGNWRPCTGDADCPVCYNWLLGPTNPNNGSSLTPCRSDADCNPELTGEFCGTTCILQWPPPDGFVNFQDISAAVFTFAGLPTVTPTDVPNIDLHGGTDPSSDPPNYLVNFNDIGLMVQAFAGWPYPYSDPGDCPDVGTWP